MGSSRSILFYILCSKNNISSRKVLIINLANSRHSHICVNNLTWFITFPERLSLISSFLLILLSYIIINIYVLFECTCIYFHTYMSYIHKTALNGHFLCMFKLKGKKWIAIMHNPWQSSFLFHKWPYRDVNKTLERVIPGELYFKV